MAIFLSQHGKSAAKEVDSNRGLTEEGVEEVKRVASWLKQGGVRVAGVRHSGKHRARQTADLFATAFGLQERVSAENGMDPLDDVTDFATRLDAATDYLYVGHLPFMPRLVSRLVAGDPERSIVKFQNGGVVCLDYDKECARWLIRWILVANLT